MIKSLPDNLLDSIFEATTQLEEQNKTPSHILVSPDMMQEMLRSVGELYRVGQSTVVGSAVSLWGLEVIQSQVLPNNSFCVVEAPGYGPSAYSATYTVGDPPTTSPPLEHVPEYPTLAKDIAKLVE